MEWGGKKGGGEGKKDSWKMNVSQAYISKLEKMETVSINNTPLSAFGGFSSQEENILLEDMY